jgi:hypothetical protein
LQSLNIDNNLKFSKGDRVKFKFILEFDDIKLDFYNIGYITDIAEVQEYGGKNKTKNNPSTTKNSYLIKYKINNCDNFYWCIEEDIIPYSTEDEREEKLNSILNG